MRLQTGLIAAGVLVVGLFILGRAVAKWLGPADEVTLEQRSVVVKLYLLVLVGVMVGVPFLFRAVPVGDTLLPSGSPLASVLLDIAFTAILPVLGFAGAWVGLRPFRATRQWVDGELRQQFLQVRFYKIAATVLVAVIVEVGYLLSVPALPLLFVSTTIAIGGILIAEPLGSTSRTPIVVYGVRRPSEDERGRVEDIYERLDIPLPDSIEVGVNDPTEKITVIRTADQRVLALSDSIFSDFDSDIQSVQIAHAEGRAKHEVDSIESTVHWLQICGLVTGVWVIFFGIWGLIFVGLSSPVVLFAPLLLPFACLGIIDQLLTRSHERVHRADEYTVEHADPSVVADVYQDPEVRHGTIADEESRNDGSNLALELPIADRLENIGLADVSNPSHSDQQGGGPDSTA